MMDKKGLDLSETVWTRLDRKAGAIVELTMRQLRHRISMGGIGCGCSIDGTTPLLLRRLRQGVFRTHR